MKVYEKNISDSAVRSALQPHNLLHYSSCCGYAYM